MDKKIISWLGVAALVLVLGAWLLTQGNATQAAVPQDLVPLNEGDPIPALHFTSVDGDTITPKDLDGKIVIVNAFASWCGPCLAETPHLVAYYQENQGDVLLIGLNVGEDESAVKNYRLQFGINYPLVLDPEGQFGKAYRIRGLPTSWFIDPQGVVRTIHTGPMTSDFIAQIVDGMK